MYTRVSVRANGSIYRCGRDWPPYFKVKREQEITKEEVAMPLLHLFAQAAHVLNAGLSFHL